MIAARAGSAWWPYLSSFMLHGALVALIAAGWFRIHAPSPPQPLQLAIEATVVTALPSSRPAAAVETIQPAPPEPEPDPAELQRQADAEQKATERKQAEQRRLEAEAAEATRQKKVEAERRIEAQKKAEADKKAEAEKKADAARKAEAEKKAEADKKALLAKQKAEEEKTRQAEALAREQAEDLRARMAAEERISAARSGAQAAQYKALIRARIEHAWIRPPTARAGLDCEVRVTQVPGGAVTAVKIDRCNADAAVRESIEAAVYRASPLPVPENPDLFERNLVFNFRPND